MLGINRTWCSLVMAGFWISSHPTLMYAFRITPASIYGANQISGRQKITPLQQTGAWVRTRQTLLTSLNALPKSSDDDDESNIEIREWRDGDEDAIYEFWIKALANSNFDPEGDISLDLTGSSRLKESYNSEDGGCFLIALTEDDSALKNKNIIGTGALIVGTPVTYYKSGSSQSSFPRVTGALRRLCFRTNVSSKTVVRFFEELERRATDAGATELIGLAFKKTDDVKQSNGLYYRPSEKTYELAGFKVLPPEEQIRGLERLAIQYSKALRPLADSAEPLASTTSLGSSDKNDQIATAVALLIGGLILTTSLFVGVANLAGFEQLVPGASNDNNGLGTPLSTQELERLLQDEQLKRTEIDMAGDRQWQDLKPEELREEQALMKIIQGQSIRQN